MESFRHLIKKANGKAEKAYLRSSPIAKRIGSDHGKAVALDKAK